MDPSAPPPLDSDRWSRIEALFHEAAELPASEQSVFLDEACAGDTELRRAVERFLAADASGSALIDGSLEDLAAPLLTADMEPAAQTAELEEGQRVGSYRILGVLGSGGMGTVYRAERADGAYERQVAIKTLRTGRLHEGAEARFERERRILARLQHPGIASLVDGGVTDSGQLYLVMELVEGHTIVDYATEKNLSVEDRVQLMIDVAEAVDYAHRNLIVHRDLKPANILVDSGGRPKLLDFGIARLTEEEPSADATATALLLTPDYASPEQIRGEAVTTATDIYALGAVLYELLALRRPFGRLSTRWADLERVLNEAPPPLSRSDGLDRAWRRALDGDLETIVRKALHKEPARRYASALDFADDLQRHLSGRPVRARPDSLRYRASKFVSRNRLASVLGAAAIATAALGVAGTVWQAREARLQAERGEAVGDFLFSLFEGADPEVNPGQAITALDLLEAGAARVDSLDAGPETRVDFLRTLGSLFGRLGEQERSEALLREAVATARDELDSDEVVYADALADLGIRLSSAGNLEEAEAALTEALQLRQAQGASPFDIATAQGNLGAALRNLARYDEAEEAYRSAISTLARETGGDTLVFASELMGLAQVLQFQDRFPEAEELLLTVRRHQLEVPERPILGFVTHNLGVVVAGLDRPDEAEAYHREALEIWQRLFPQGHPEVARSLEQIARNVQAQGRFDEADSLYSVAIDRWSERYGESHTHLAAIRANQATLRYQQGNFAAAAEAFREGVRIWRVTGERVVLGVGLRNLAVIETQLGEYASADTLLAEALELRRDLYGDAHVLVAETYSAIASLRNGQGRYVEAEEQARVGIGQYVELGEAEHRNVSNTRMVLGRALAGQGRWEEARTELEPVFAEFEGTINPLDPRLGSSGLWLAVSLRNLGEAGEAAAILERILPHMREGLDVDHPERIRAEAEYARLVR